MTGIHYIHMGSWPVFVGFTTDKKAFAKEVKRLKVEDGPEFLSRARAAASTHFFVHEGTLVCLIAMQPFKKVTAEQYAALLAHEAVHVVQQIRRELNKDEALGDEAEAYLLQHIVQECLQVAWGSTKERSIAP